MHGQLYTLGSMTCKLGGLAQTSLCDIEVVPNVHCILHCDYGCQTFEIWTSTCLLVNSTFLK